MTPEVDILIESDLWSRVAGLEGLAREAIAATLSQTGLKIAPQAEVSILFCDDSRIRELNREWRRLDKATNVLSFPAVTARELPRAPLLGDIAIAFETVERESRDEAKTFEHHVSHMIVHGFLHLLGFDHEVVSEAEAMEEAERGALARIGVADPYAGADLAGESFR